MAKIAINKSLLKEYNGSTNERIVYMEDGDEFQIQFFNPETCVIAVSISLNGKNFSNYLVLRPGERVWLERFIDSEQKFKFSTYEVGASEEVKKAIEKNGVIELKFYKEVNYRTPVFINTSTTWYKSPSIPDYDYSYSISCVSDDSAANSVKTNLSDCIETLRSAGAATMDSCDCEVSAASTISASCYYSSPVNAEPHEGGRSMARKLSANKSIETGRIEKGNHSNQEINYVSGYNFSYYPFAEELIHIYPKSTKPVYKSDLTKRYCTNCGRKVSPKYKFCPGCGKKIN